MKKYEEINIGDQELIKHKISKDDINRFVELTGDDNRLHVDEKFAKRTQFKKPVVHGMLGASFISTIIGTKIPGDGALWFSQTLEFLLPVRIGDELTITAEVIKKNDKEQIIELETKIFNQNRQIVTKGLAKVKVIQEIDQTEALPIEALEDREKVALVIGGTGGIGQAVCRQLAKDGHKVIVHYNRNKVLADEIVADLEALDQKGMSLEANILEEDEIDKMVSRAMRKFGSIDILVNCAATVIPNIKFENLLWSDYQKQLELNIKSTFFLIKKVLPSMTQNKYGKIVNIGSLSLDKPNSDWSHYITAKAALVGFTKSLAFELAPNGVRVNMVTPSLVSTDLTADVPEKVKLKTAAQTPLRRLALANDVAGAVSFLVSEKSDFVNGENLRVNGGQVML